MYQVCASLSSKLPQLYQWQAFLVGSSVKHRLTETYESTLVLDYIPYFSSVIRKKRDTPESNYSTL